MIGIFDSGVGGLSVYLEIKKLLPNQSFYYLADGKNAPYGTKTPTQIKKFTLNALSFLRDRGVELIVIACNTATVSGIDYYRKRIKTPLVGLVPAIKPASENPKSKVICLLTTDLTKKSRYQQKLIHQFAKNKKVIQVSDSQLVNFVEDGDFSSTKFRQKIKQLIDKLENNNVDSLVFGCTHFVFLKKYLNKNLFFYDSGEAVAKRTKRLVKNTKQPPMNDIFATTGDPNQFSKVSKIITAIKLVPSQVKL